MADIVIVEDDDSVARAYTLGLQHHGHVVRVAHDEAGLRGELGDRIPDLLILDIGLPGVDGVEILRGLREEPETAALRVAVLSNYTDRNLVHRALRLDAVEFVEKAATTPTLLADQVRRWLETG